MAKGNFGERLKREREMREVSLAEVTSGTRISQRFLEALENEEWDKLPGGIFSRGFVRSIARYLGLNEEDLLSEFDLARGEQKMEAPAPYENRLPSPPKWIPAIALLALIGVLAGLFYAGRYRLAALCRVPLHAIVRSRKQRDRWWFYQDARQARTYRLHLGAVACAHSGGQPGFTGCRRNARRHPPFLRRPGISNQRSGRVRSASGVERTTNHLAGCAWKTHHEARLQSFLEIKI